MPTFFSRVMDAYLYAVAEVNSVEGLEALSLALDKIEAQVGLVTETDPLANVRKAIQVREAWAAKQASLEDS